MLDTIRRRIDGKRVLILGYGREGKSTLRLVQNAGGAACVALCDRNPLEGSELDGLEIISGPSYQSRLDEFDVIFKSPGIVLEHPTDGLMSKITSQTELFLERYREQTIGITGTKGKSTTTTLLFHALAQSGRSCVLAGNIGIPAFDTVGQIGPDTMIVYELSCHQLEYAKVSPHIAIFLNLFEEHLDHYGTFEKYAQAKQNIYRYQSQEDTLVCRKDCAPPEHAGQCVTFDRLPGADMLYSSGGIRWGETLYSIPTGEIDLVGEHNAANIAAAFAAARLCGLDWVPFCDALRSYRALPHRLEPVGEIDGVEYIDDSISTICESAIQAMQSLSNVGSVLIGGMDRGIDYAPLEEYFTHCDVDHIILMYDTGKRIYQELCERYPLALEEHEVHLADTLEEAVALAKQKTPRGKCCLLSPAAASYGVFRNFEERGDRFQKLIQE